MILWVNKLVQIFDHKMKRIYLLFIVLFSGIAGMLATARVNYTINDGWYFEKGNNANSKFFKATIQPWEFVNIPHTYNNIDGNDDEPGYYRGVVCYRKNICIDKVFENKNVYIYFEGANQVTELKVNGQFAGKHIGGYTRFCFDITDYVQFGKQNTFEIIVDNSYNKDIPPLTADFTFYGGIYRDVNLVYTDKVHLALNPYATTGVYIKTPQVSKEKASVEITYSIDNNSDRDSKIVVENSVIDPEGKLIKTIRKEYVVSKQATSSSLIQTILLDNPVLWDVVNPRLYSLYTRIYDKQTGKLVDEVSNTFGLRWFEFKRDEGFFLNGRLVKLHGTNRHQDYLGLGNALRDEMHVHDIKLLKEMGINFLRISHYPQDPTVLDLCDKLGIIATVEIPVVNEISETTDFMNNSVFMLKEMIRQNFNHPSVVIWGYMNEILLKQPYTNPDELDRYYKTVEKVARTLEYTVRTEDASRYTMMACHNAPDRYEKAKLTEIPMILGWNLYQGWYEPDLNKFEIFLDNAHNTYKDKILLVTEYGSGVDERLHSFNPERFDFTQEYGLIYHQHCYNEMMQRPFIAGFTMWNFNDFYAEQRIDVQPHVNNKGVTGLDREKKDEFLFYQSVFNQKPYVMIGNKEWKTRGGVSEIDKDLCWQPLPVFSNLNEIELKINNKSLGIKKCDENVAIFQVPFVPGENMIEAIGLKDSVVQKDFLRINFNMIPFDLRKQTVSFSELNVMLGSNRYYEDRKAAIIWIPEKQYTSGSWGFVGGEAYRRKTGFGSLPGTDVSIIGTDNDAVFQTQRVGLESFKADVPEGKYSIYCYWAEFNSKKQIEASIYNLGGGNTTNSPAENERIFNVEINGTTMLNNFNITNEYGSRYAVIKKFIVDVKNGEGITLNLIKIKGETILNAIRIFKHN